jgi:hypothetical protein
MATEKRKRVSASKRKVFSFRLNSENVEAVRKKHGKKFGKDGVNLSKFVDDVFQKEAEK